jgi:hypothetical protein
MPPNAPEVYTVSNIKVTIAGVTDQAGDMNALLFRSCTPPAWSCDAPKHVFHGDQGPESIVSDVLFAQYSPMQLEQGWDADFCMAKWKATVEDTSKAITDKKKDVKVDFLKSDGQTIIFSYHTEAGIITSYQTSPSEAGSNAVLTVNVTIDADKWEQLDSGGSPISSL